MCSQSPLSDSPPILDVQAWTGSQGEVLSIPADVQVGRIEERGVQKDFFQRREFTFVLQGDAWTSLEGQTCHTEDIFCRYQCFKDMEDHLEYKAKVLERQPIRMEIGAVFSHAPSKHNLAYKPLERELVFDIDMDDYDDIRTCCTGSKLCLKCWTFMKAVTGPIWMPGRVSFIPLRRTSVSSISSSCTRGVVVSTAGSATPRHESSATSSVRRWRSISPWSPAVLGNVEQLLGSRAGFKKWFEEPNGILESQDILRKDLPHLEKILESFSVALLDSEHVFFHATSMQIWRKLEQIANARKTSDSESQSALSLTSLGLKKRFLPFSPRLDINVSKQMNHLLKSPFVVHPKTGRVCVPIDPDNLKDFDPATVPTIGKLVEELSLGKIACGNEEAPFSTMSNHTVVDSPLHFRFSIYCPLNLL
eukprot:Skav219144  [mRNA]  locus=scaffold1574:741194:747181:+ [translate_table: standard]